MKIFSFLIPEKYKAINANDVAKAMVEISKKDDEGVFTHEYSAIKELVGR
jgi:hypothetical protein